MGPMAKMMVCGMLAVAGALVAHAVRAAEPDLVVYTESYPPYNFMGDDGAVAGSATEKVRQVLDAAGFTYRFRLMPWPRALLFARTEQNALIFSMTRTPAREAQYDWLVPIADADFRVFKHAGDGRPITFEAIRDGQFSGACVSGDLTCDLLRYIGLPEDRLTLVTNNTTGDFRMVAAGRADIYISEASVNRRLRRQEGFAQDLTIPVMRLEGEYGFYLVAGLHVAPAVRQRVRATYERLKREGRYDLLLLTDEDR